jgi:glucose-6-phosphate 1-dehydrogenase
MTDEHKQLLKENERLRSEIKNLKDYVDLLENSLNEEGAADRFKIVESKDKEPIGIDNTRLLCVVVLGASGDLAKKKTFPALFALYNRDLLPKDFIVLGYSRSKMTDEEFRQKCVSVGIKNGGAKLTEFEKRCFYVVGQYDSQESFKHLASVLEQHEKASNKPGTNRLFYMALPPSVFISAATGIKTACMSKNGWNRIVVEKPFGKDTESSAQLNKALGSLFAEDQIFRIDHYLGKELVQNLMILRFANMVFEPIWNKHYINVVMITFKEPFGTEGRGGYFDEFGIIRDVMQNHLIQILSIAAMEPPVTLLAEDIQNEKVKVLRAIPPLELSKLVIGQYTREGKNPGYLEDPGVPKNSLCPTFACAVLHINNDRWSGVPFILKCGKALNERKAEIRIQFKRPGNHLFPGAAPNELVMRLQPNEAIYLKISNKMPGLSNELVQSELDLTYNSRFQKEVAGGLPDAYERLILDVIRGDHNLFVRVDELQAAWRIFTPVLHQLEKEKIAPILYPFGSRGPPEADQLAYKYGNYHFRHF